MQTEDQTPLETVTPTDLEQAQPLAEEVSTDPSTEQTAETTEKQPQEAPKPKTDWAQRRIDQLTREKYEERRLREASEARLREIQPHQAQTGQATTHDQIREEAKKLIQEERFNESCNKVFDAGKTEFSGDWDSSLRTFSMLGGASQDFLEAVTSMDHGHKVLHALGQDPETAERVLSLPPVRMAIELAKIEASLSAPKPAPTPPPVSRAPEPIKPVGSGRVAPAGLSDDLPIDEWMRRHNKR